MILTLEQLREKAAKSDWDLVVYVRNHTENNELNGTDLPPDYNGDDEHIKRMIKFMLDNNVTQLNMEQADKQIILQFTMGRL